MAGIIGHVEKVDEVSGVSGVRSAAFFKHLLAISMVSGDEGPTARLQQSREDKADTTVDCFHRTYASG